MSCNGCRILRKGCSEDCMLRQSLEWIGNPQAQSNATLFVANFFGRAGLMSFISAVPRSQRPALFQSLLFEAVGRTVNPVSGVVGLLWTGNWVVCQAAVTTVLRGSTVEPIQELDNCNKAGKVGPELDNISESCCNFRAKADHPSLMRKKRKSDDADLATCEPASLEFGLTRRRDATPSEESETTTFRSEDDLRGCESENKLLRLFLIITYHTDALPSSYTNSCWVSCKDARELKLRDHKYPNMWLTGDESSKAWTGNNL